MHGTIWLQIRIGIDISKTGQKRFWGVYIALRELQCTKAAGAKKSKALLFGLESKNVTKWNILFTPTFVSNFKVPDCFDQK